MPSPKGPGSDPWLKIHADFTEFFKNFDIFVKDIENRKIELNPDLAQFNSTLKKAVDGINKIAGIAEKVGDSASNSFKKPQKTLTEFQKTATEAIGAVSKEIGKTDDAAGKLAKKNLGDIVNNSQAAKMMAEFALKTELAGNEVEELVSRLKTIRDKQKINFDTSDLDSLIDKIENNKSASQALVDQLNKKQNSGVEVAAQAYKSLSGNIRQVALEMSGLGKSNVNRLLNVEGVSSEMTRVVNKVKSEKEFYEQLAKYAAIQKDDLAAAAAIKISKGEGTAEEKHSANQIYEAAKKEAGPKEQKPQSVEILNKSLEELNSGITAVEGGFVSFARLSLTNSARISDAFGKLSQSAADAGGYLAALKTSGGFTAAANMMMEVGKVALNTAGALVAIGDEGIKLNRAMIAVDVASGKYASDMLRNGNISAAEMAHQTSEGAKARVELTSMALRLGTTKEAILAFQSGLVNSGLRMQGSGAAIDMQTAAGRNQVNQLLVMQKFLGLTSEKIGDLGTKFQAVGGKGTNLMKSFGVIGKAAEVAAVPPNDMADAVSSLTEGLQGMQVNVNDLTANTGTAVGMLKQMHMTGKGAINMLLGMQSSAKEMSSSQKFAANEILKSAGYGLELKRTIYAEMNNMKTSEVTDAQAGTVTQGQEFEFGQEAREKGATINTKEFGQIPLKMLDAIAILKKVAGIDITKKGEGKNIGVGQFAAIDHLQGINASDKEFMKKMTRNYAKGEDFQKSISDFKANENAATGGEGTATAGQKAGDIMSKMAGKEKTAEEGGGREENEFSKKFEEATNRLTTSGEKLAAAAELAKQAAANNTTIEGVGKFNDMLTTTADGLAKKLQEYGDKYPLLTTALEGLTIAAGGAAGALIAGAGSGLMKTMGKKILGYVTGSAAAETAAVAGTEAAGTASATTAATTAAGAGISTAAGLVPIAGAALAAGGVMSHYKNQAEDAEDESAKSEDQAIITEQRLAARKAAQIAITKGRSRDILSELAKKEYDNIKKRMSTSNAAQVLTESQITGSNPSPIKTPDISPAQTSAATDIKDTLNQKIKATQPKIGTAESMAKLGGIAPVAGALNQTASTTATTQNLGGMDDIIKKTTDSFAALTEKITQATAALAGATSVLANNSGTESKLSQSTFANNGTGSKLSQSLLSAESPIAQAGKTALNIATIAATAPAEARSLAAAQAEADAAEAGADQMKLMLGLKKDARKAAEKALSTGKGRDALTSDLAKKEYDILQKKTTITKETINTKKSKSYTGDVSQFLTPEDMSPDHKDTVQQWSKQELKHQEMKAKLDKSLGLKAPNKMLEMQEEMFKRNPEGKGTFQYSEKEGLEGTGRPQTQTAEKTETLAKTLPLTQNPDIAAQIAGAAVIAPGLSSVQNLSQSTKSNSSMGLSFAPNIEIKIETNDPAMISQKIATEVVPLLREALGKAFRAQNNERSGAAATSNS